MRFRPPSRLAETCVILAVMAAASGAAADVRVWPLKVDDGCCEIVLDASAEYVLVLGSLASWNHPCTVRLRAEATTEAPRLPILTAQENHVARRSLARRAAQLSRDRAALAGDDRFPPAASIPATKTFHLPRGRGDLGKRDRYQAVEARLHSFNRVCQVYVDAAEEPPAHRDQAAAEILRCFQDEVLPWASEHVGSARDVDRDGRFTVFLSGRLDDLVEEGQALDGFVRGSDFVLDLPAPFSNRCDMMTLHSRLKPGARLRTLLLHEFVHAVTITGHALADYKTGSRGEDEESWLSESMAHVAEEMRGFSRCNFECRVRAYLEATARHPIVVPDAHAAGLWRDPGVRGAGFLFLRSAAARQRRLAAGAEPGSGGLLYRLAQSNLRGLDNLEVASGELFEEHLRRFGVELIVEGWRLKPGDSTWPAAWRPSAVGLTARTPAAEVRLAGTAIAFVHVHGWEGERVRLTALTPQAPLQATLLQLPRAEKQAGESGR